MASARYGLTSLARRDGAASGTGHVDWLLL